MAKCSNCDYPYASGKQCPNCGSKNPSGNNTIGVIILIVIVYFLIKGCAG
jgi:RNA polymerase subunit RPABC4/transcription elongation factor Spt4